MQGREIMILRSSIASLKQYNQHLLEQNKALKDLVKKYMKFLEELQSSLDWPKSFFDCTNYIKGM